jgi:hypothetical protein
MIFRTSNTAIHEFEYFGNEIEVSPLRETLGLVTRAQSLSRFLMMMIGCCPIGS